MYIKIKCKDAHTESENEIPLQINLLRNSIKECLSKPRIDIFLKLQSTKVCWFDSILKIYTQKARKYALHETAIFLHILIENFFTVFWDEVLLWNPDWFETQYRPSRLSSPQTCSNSPASVSEGLLIIGFCHNIQPIKFLRKIKAHREVTRSLKRDFLYEDTVSELKYGKRHQRNKGGEEFMQLYFPLITVYKNIAKLKTGRWLHR